jgi:DNA-binding response OmpR family regulator
MRILVIEDEQKIAKAIKKGLEQEAFAVDLAFDGEEGFDLASTEDYDLIILDRMMPKMDGMQVCENLRQEKITIPILMLTALGQVENRVDGLNSGADDYLVKPFAFEELLARTRALMRRPKQTTGNGKKLQVDDLILDTVELKVTRSGKEIELSKREFSLLEYLMRYPKQILTKEQIIAHVWDFDADVLPNTVEVYIGYLRNKIDKKFKKSKALIKTVRGFGYKME